MRSAVFSVVIVLLSAVSLSAQTWYVKPDGSGDRPTIQAAVDAAASGDTVLLANGIFTGEDNRDVYIFYASLTVRSEAGDPDYCVIDVDGAPADAHQAFDIRFAGNPPVVLEGVTITGGYTASGGAVYVAKNGSEPCNTVIRNCRFSGNASQWSGGAILVAEDCRLSLEDCEFSINTSMSGGAIAVMGTSALSADGCNFEGNAAIYGYGGAVCGNNSADTLTNCTFLDNFASNGGGAVYGYGGGGFDMASCSFLSNSTDGGGGAILVQDCDLAMVACVSLRNSGSSGGSVYCAEGTYADIMNCTFVADSSGYGALYVDPVVTAYVSYTVIAFAKNAAAIACGAPPVPPYLYCCDLFGNEYGDYTGCIAPYAGVDGNISQDPRFCNMPSGDVSHEDCSPCLAVNRPDGFGIGARGYADSGCSCGEATVPTTWGAIKASYK